MSATGRWRLYRLPLNEVVLIYDRLKLISRGYASHYEMQNYEEGDLVKVSILAVQNP